MNKTSKTRIDSLISGGVAPTRLKGSDAMGLRGAGRSIIKLVNDDGDATAVGKYWSLKSGEPLPAGGYLQQTATRVGNVESIKMRDGGSGVTRRWNEGTGEYKFTALGRALRHIGRWRRSDRCRSGWSPYH